MQSEAKPLEDIVIEYINTSTGSKILIIKYIKKEFKPYQK